MTDINLKDFDKNNWDEFVHLGALKDVIDQDNAINNEQNQQITQNTNDVTTAKQEAEDAKNTAESAQNTANEAKTTADGLSDKVDTAQSTAEDAKSVADEAKTSADNASKIAGMAQNTVTLLGTQVSQLDSEVIKRTSDTSIFKMNSGLNEISDGKVIAKMRTAIDNIGNMYKNHQSFEVRGTFKGSMLSNNQQLYTLTTPVDGFVNEIFNGFEVINLGNNTITIPVNIYVQSNGQINISTTGFSTDDLTALQLQSEQSYKVLMFAY